MGSSGRPCGGWLLCGLLLCLLCAGVASQESESGFDDASATSSSTASLSTTETLAPTSTSPATTAPESTSSATITPSTTRATTPPAATEASTPLSETTEAATPLPDPTEEVTQPPDPTEEATPPPDPTEDATPPPEDATPPPNATEGATLPPETTEAATPPPETAEAATPPPETTEAATPPPETTEDATPPPETTEEPTPPPETTEVATPPPETTEAPVTESPTPTTTPPSTTAPSTDEPPPPTAAPVVERYNSSTLPPELDPSMLNGSDLVNVEVTETTQEDGSTSYSYVIITKVGETVRTIVLSPASSPATSAPIAASADTAKSGSSLSDTINSGKSSSSIGIGGIIGIVAGTLVFTFVVVAFFILERRRSTKGRPSDASSDDIFVPPAVDKQVRLLEQGQAMAETEYADVSRTTANSHSSGGSMPDGRRQRATLWEDPAILASRIPIDRIELGIVIGHGAFGEVYRGRYREHDVAVKTLLPEKRKDMAHIQAFLSEVRIMATMEHPNIVLFIGVAWESLSDLFCVTEFMTGGDLRTLLKDYLAHDVPQGMDATKMQIAYEVAFALTYLHSLQPAMLHRDLKSRNILLTESLHAKITDFGASRIRSDATMTSNVGSALWMAPEVMMSGHYGEKADVFSLGVVISELDTHELPYSHAKEEGSSSGRSLPDAAVLQMVSMGKLRVRLSSFMHPELVQLVEKCVSVDPDDRPTAAEVVYFLQTAIKNRQY